MKIGDTYKSKQSPNKTVKILETTTLRVKYEIITKGHSPDLAQIGDEYNQPKNRFLDFYIKTEKESFKKIKQNYDI